MCDSHSVECSHYDLHWCGAVYFGRYKSKVVPAHNMKTCKWTGVITPLILDLGIGRRWMIVLTSRSRYPWWRNPPSSFNRRLVGPQGRSERFGEEKYLLPSPGFKLRFVQSVALSVYWLSCKSPGFLADRHQYKRRHVPGKCDGDMFGVFENEGRRMGKKQEDARKFIG